MGIAASAAETVTNRFLWVGLEGLARLALPTKFKAFPERSTGEEALGPSPQTDKTDRLLACLAWPVSLVG